MKHGCSFVAAGIGALALVLGGTTVGLQAQRGGGVGRGGGPTAGQGAATGGRSDTAGRPGGSGKPDGAGGGKPHGGGGKPDGVGGGKPDGARSGKPDGVGAGKPDGAGGKPDDAGTTDGKGRSGNTGRGKDATDNDARGQGSKAKPTLDARAARNANLMTRLQGLFPAGTDLQKASEGFKNFGQFVAAAHVSNNLDIPFDALKAKMTGDHPESLGKAIGELKPTADTNTEVKKAEKAADTDIKDAGKPTSKAS
jgi:hypothetical protein